MASGFILVAIQILMVAVMAIRSTATDYVVGDDQGWTTPFDYRAWVAGKDFHVGDKLIFKYKKGDHDVHLVDETAYDLCLTSTDNEPLRSGKDEIILVSAGTKWYICGVGNHCETGNQKLLINVTAAVSTIPDSADVTFRPCKYLGIMVIAFGLLYLQVLI